MNNPLLDQFRTAAAGNATLTGATKDVDEAMKSWAAANPDATAQDIAQHRAGLLAQKRRRRSSQQLARMMAALEGFGRRPG